MIARFAPAEYKVDTSKLSPGDQKTLAKLIEAGAGGGSFPHGAAADGTEIQEISPTVEDDAEAYLIEHIIRDLANVTEFEHCPLAHAILRQVDSAAEMGALKDRVAFLISKIADRVSLDESGTYVHRVAKTSLRR